MGTGIMSRYDCTWSSTNCSCRRYMRASSAGCLTLPAFSSTCSVLCSTCGAVIAGAACGSGWQGGSRRAEGGGAERQGCRGARTRAAHLDAQPVLQRVHARLGLPRVGLRVCEQLRHLRHVRPPGAWPRARGGVPGVRAAAGMDARGAG